MSRPPMSTFQAIPKDPLPINSGCCACSSSRGRSLRRCMLCLAERRPRTQCSVPYSLLLCQRTSATLYALRHAGAVHASSYHGGVCRCTRKHRQTRACTVSVHRLEPRCVCRRRSESEAGRVQWKRRWRYEEGCAKRARCAAVWAWLERGGGDGA